jgi:predicted aspartyl protease
VSETPDCATVPDEPTLHFPEAGVVRVPFRRGSNHVLVDVVDAAGRAHVFFVDTGASFSVVSPRFAEMIGAPARESEPVDAAHGVGGELPGVPTMHELRDLRVGDLRIERAGAIRLDLGLDGEFDFEIAGVLGYIILSRLVTEIDYAAGVVVFRPAGSKADARKPDHVVPFRLRMGVLIEVDASVNGAAAIPFVFDIGSPWTFINTEAALSTGTDLGEATASVGGVSGRTGRPKSIRLGSVAFEDPEIHVADLPVFATVGLGETSTGLLGNDLLSGYRVAIDYGASELRLWK